MSDLVVTNWFGDLISHPHVLVEAGSVNDIVAVMKDSNKYPSPVRAVGSNHSTERCGVIEGGTLIKMTGMNRILSITSDAVTVEAGALYIDIATELEKHGLQFYVNTEIGSLSAGSAACAGTKDASMPGEFGQVGSYVTNLKMVLANGDLLEVSEDQADLMRKVRSSYGTFGIVYEVTFRVRAIQPLAVYHETYKLEEFIAKYAEMKSRNQSLMFYIFPFDNLITVEFRSYNPAATGAPNRHIWQLRNYLWKSAGPLVCYEVERDIPIPAVRYKVIDEFNAVWRFKLTNIVRSDNTIAADQIIRYPTVSDNTRYTFSLWAYPDEKYGEVLTDTFRFSRDYYQNKGYRNNMLHVGYRIAQDQNSLLSYSWDGPVATVDPVSTGNPGWKEYLAAYNEFSSDRGGSPLFNQTFGVTRAQAQKAFGDRLKIFAETRKNFDPTGRLLNGYFRDLLEVPA